MLKHARTLALGTALALASVALSAPATSQTVMPRPSEDLNLSTGTGRMIRLDSPMSDVFIANPGVADVQVESADQLYVFGKAAGETTLFATNQAGRIVYSANVRIGNNIASVSDMLRVAMPGARIEAIPMNGLMLLTGTVASPADVEDAERLTEAFLGEGTQVMNRLKTATPLQVMLKVTIAEVSRSLTKTLGASIQASDRSGSSLFGFTRGRDVTSGGTILSPADTSTFGIVGRALGLDIAAAADLNEENGLVAVLAEPTLTALSGETASFLAGGEFPIPVAEGINGTSIEFKEYGVSLAFTPIVLDTGRISMRVRPEVSELTSEGAITIGSIEIPGLTTRRTETTVELGSGQSLVLSGLMRNNHNNLVERTPFLGSLPIIGALFRSDNYRRNQSELLVVVTPYLVKPVDAGRIALPTDGYRTASDPGRLILGQEHDSRAGEQRPKPSMAPAQVPAPAIDTGSVPAGGAQGSASLPRPGFGL